MLTFILIPALFGCILGENNSSESDSNDLNNLQNFPNEGDNNIQNQDQNTNSLCHPMAMTRVVKCETSEKCITEIWDYSSGQGIYCGCGECEPN